MHTIGPITLGKIPRIVGILENPLETKQILKLHSSGVSILEVRIDAFETPQLGLDYLQSLSENSQIHSQFALLATHRENDQNKGKRVSIFSRAVLYADAIDVEYECEEKHELITLAKEKQKLSILSSHDFNSTPKNTHLQSILNTSQSLGADISKIAVFAHDNDDFIRLMDFTKENAKSALVTISMGEYGALSRVQALFYGSLFSYGYIDNANAPGQLSTIELHNELMRYHPLYKKDFLSHKKNKA